MLEACKTCKGKVGFIEEINTPRIIKMANKRLKPYKNQGRIEFTTPISVG